MNSLKENKAMFNPFPVKAENSRHAKVLKQKKIDRSKLRQSKHTGMSKILHFHVNIHLNGSDHRSKKVRWLNGYRGTGAGAFER